MALTQVQGQMLAPGQTLSVNGITFPATQVPSADANTLDDYEEGTWTPSVGGTSTYSSASGQYVKIGRFVVATFDMAITNIGTGNSNNISGLPFAAGGSVQGQAGSVGYFSNLAAAVSYVALRADIGSSSIATAATQGNQATITAGLGIFGNNARVVGTIYYQVS